MKFFNLLLSTTFAMTAGVLVTSSSFAQESDDDSYTMPDGTVVGGRTTAADHHAETPAAKHADSEPAKETELEEAEAANDVVPAADVKATAENSVDPEDETSDTADRSIGSVSEAAVNAPDFQLCFELVHARCYTADSSNPGVLRQTGGLSDSEGTASNAQLKRLQKDLAAFVKSIASHAPTSGKACTQQINFRMYDSKSSSKESLRCLENLSKAENAKLEALTTRLSNASKPKTK